MPGKKRKSFRIWGNGRGGGSNGREVYMSRQRKITPGKVHSKGHLSEW